MADCLEMPRHGNWIQIASGKCFYPLDPRPEDIDIEDIAHSLSMQCRFNGHCTKFYSVAEHSVILSTFCSYENALWGLLHDAAEAYTSDIPRPLKLDLGHSWNMIESYISYVISKKFNLNPKTMPAEVKHFDNRILHTEKLQVMRPCEQEWQELPEPLDVQIEGLNPVAAKEAFLDRFHLLIDWKYI